MTAHVTDLTIDSSTPELSVILVTPGKYESIRKTTVHVSKQTAVDKVQLVILSPFPLDQFGLNQADFGPLKHVKYVHIQKWEGTGHARGTAIRAATAPVIAIAEDHSFPRPTWAENLIKAHQLDYDAIGPQICNANPATGMSWANMLIAYGNWYCIGRGTIDDLPGHNSSYKRAVLMAYGEKLEEMFERESFLHKDLKSKNRPLYIEPDAQTDHMNVSRWGPSLSLRFNAGRVFASSRAANGKWGIGKKLVYVAAAPLFPIIHLRDVLKYVKRGNGQVKLFPNVLPACMLNLVAGAVGEQLGYLFGEGNARRTLAEAEFTRPQDITSSDRQAVFAA